MLLLHIGMYKQKVKPSLSLYSLWEFERGYVTSKIISITKRFMYF